MIDTIMLGLMGSIVVFGLFIFMKDTAEEHILYNANDDGCSHGGLCRRWSIYRYILGGLTMRGTLEKQLELEAEMMTGGIQRFRKARDKAITSGRESHTLHGRTIVARIVEAVAEG